MSISGVGLEDYYTLKKRGLASGFIILGVIGVGFIITIAEEWPGIVCR